jgi:hypothetical protein
MKEKLSKIITGGIETSNPMEIITYGKAHEKVTKIHEEAVDSISMPGVCKRAKEETEKMVKRK